MMRLINLKRRKADVWYLDGKVHMYIYKPNHDLDVGVCVGLSELVKDALKHFSERLNVPSSEREPDGLTEETRMQAGVESWMEDYDAYESIIVSLATVLEDAKAKKKKLDKRWEADQ